MISSLKNIVVVFFVLTIVIFQFLFKSVDCSVKTRLQSSRLPRQDDYDEPINSISSYPGGPGGRAARVGMPRLDNRNTFDNLNTWARPRPRCNKKIRIVNGVTRFRNKGSIVKYMCSHGFSLFGENLAVCLRDQWSEPPPICVRPGCPRIQESPNIVARMTNGGAVVAFFCYEGHRLDGSGMLYCDGSRWNGTVPTCQKIFPLTTPSSTVQMSEMETMGESVLSLHTEQVNTTKNIEAWDYNPTTLLSVQTIETTEPSTNALEVSRKNNLSHTTAFSVVETTKTQDIDFETIVDSITMSSNQHEIESTVPSIAKANFETTPKVTITTGKWPIIQLSSQEPTKVPSRQNTKFTTMLPFILFKTTILTLPHTSTNKVLLTTVPTKITTTTKRPTTTPFKTTPPLTDKPKTRWTRPSTISATTSTTQAATIGTTEDFEPFPDGTFDKFDEEFSSPYDSRVPEFIQPLQPISPHALDNDHSREDHVFGLGQMSIIGVLVAVICSLFCLAAIAIHYWKKNKGIARARPYDVDGRTLSASDAMDDFMWLETRDSRM